MRTDRSVQVLTSTTILVLTLICLSGLHVILQGAVWWFDIALLCILTLGIVAILRGVLAPRRVWLPSIIATVVVGCVLVLFFVPQNAILGFIPTPATVGDISDLIAAANFSIAHQSLPAIATAPVLFLLCAGVSGIALAADILAQIFHAPAFAGFPLLILLAVPSAITVDATDPVIFIAAALGFLGLLRIGRRGPRLTTTLGFAAAVMVGAFLVPLALPQVDESSAVGTGFSSGVNPVLSLGQNLRQGADHTVLTYSTTTGASQYLRMVSIDNFSGKNWAPHQFVLDPKHTIDSIGAPPGLSPSVRTTVQTSYISVKDLTSPWLPLPYPTSHIGGLTGEWFWDTNGLTVQSPTNTAQGQNYRVSSLTLDPTPTQLDTAGSTVPAELGRYRDLPSNIPKIILDTAKKVAGAGGSNYEKALLLQNYFRGGTFKYSETAPVNAGYDGTGMKVIAAFLAAKKGYCIHFASAMAVMARVLGIPSRIEVGFLPGSRSSSTGSGSSSFTVTSHNLHAWPELYFEGIGWTRFEPTASRGNLPDYATAAVSGAVLPVSPSNPASTQQPAPTQSVAASQAAKAKAKALAAADAAATHSVEVTAQPSPALLLLFAGLLIVGLLPALFRHVQRRRRLVLLRRLGSRPSLGVAWKEVLQTAQDLGIAVPATSTPRELATALASASHPLPHTVHAGGSDRAADTPLQRIRAGVEEENFAQRAPAVYPGAAADTELVLAGLRAGCSHFVRLKARLVPSSTWMSLLGRASPSGGAVQRPPRGPEAPAVSGDLQDLGL